MADRKQVLSCLQPTGNFHFGRYFGAIQNWVRLQDQYDCFYGVVDYHALTMPFDPKKLRENTWEVTFSLLACGIRSENVFIQSMIPEHAELAWILGCMCSYGELQKMTQFKDKSRQVKAQSKDVFISSGLFTYPVLQAADIIIYHADYVPVGKDQEQHLELTRNISQRFNYVVNVDYFTLPEPLFTRIPKVMSTADPTRKMSASLGHKHNIDVFADPKVIRKQIRSAVTDSGESSGRKMSPGVSNLFSLLEAAGGEAEHHEAMQLYHEGSLRYGEFKDTVADALIRISDPIREKFQELKSDRKSVKSQVRESTNQIRLKAQKTLREVKELTGLQIQKM